uniref:Uncharacterized protein n=1 Tax=Romanomermis culicivorax TaxID=13658 RepID=A0A915ILB9_ROMCU
MAHCLARELPHHPPILPRVLARDFILTLARHLARDLPQDLSRTWQLMKIMKRNGTECNRYNVTEEKGNFRSVRFCWRLPSVIFLDCSYPSRSKVDFEAERFKLFRSSVPFRFRRKRQV